VGTSSPAPQASRLTQSPLALPDPSSRHPTPVSSDTEEHVEMTEDQKRRRRHSQVPLQIFQRLPNDQAKDRRVQRQRSQPRAWSPKSSEQSWRLATGGRFRANGYACFLSQPFQNLSRNLFPPRGFSPTGDSAAFNGTARQPSPVKGTCPVQPSTPLGPDQANVPLLFLDHGE
jgi:hypothetical protein